MDENFDITRMSRAPAVPFEEYGQVKTWVLVLSAILISFGLIPIIVMLVTQGDPVAAITERISVSEFYLSMWQFFTPPVFTGLLIAALNIRIKSNTLAGEHRFAVGVTIYGLLMVAVPLLIILMFGQPW
jgi:hypothetical protein